MDDQRDYEEEAYNRAEMEREARDEYEHEQRKANGMADGLAMRLERELLKGAVQQRITCHISGTVLDVRTAVLMTVTGRGISQEAVYDGKVFDAKILPNVKPFRDKGLTVEIIDGRKLK